jgi:lambda repressor-like predicted transcriptional regulator
MGVARPPNWWLAVRVDAGAPNTVRLEETPRFRIELLKARLRTLGLSHSALAKRLGVRPNALNKAIYERCSESLERQIAEAAQTTPYEVWPDRYHPNGERRARPPRRQRRRGGAA